MVSQASRRDAGDGTKKNCSVRFDLPVELWELEPHEESELEGVVECCKEVVSFTAQIWYATVFLRNLATVAFRKWGAK